MAKTTTRRNRGTNPTTAAPGPGLTFPRWFTKNIPPCTVFDGIEWETRTAAIENTSGKSVFRQEGIEVPKDWSQQATNIVADKYFRGNPDTKEREHSVRQLISRVADTITRWGENGGYFAAAEDREAFRDELTHLLVYQMAAFNSPVWFNVGWDEHAQCSACLPYEARVNTTDGLIMIGELHRRAGMRLDLPHVFDRNGNHAAIQATACNGKRCLVRLHLADGSVLALTSDHQVFVQDRHGNELLKSAGEIVEREDFLICPRIQLGKPCTDVNHIDRTPGDAWLAGLMASNGFSGRPESATSDTWELKIANANAATTAAREIARRGLSHRTKTFDKYTLIRGYGRAGREFWTSLEMWNKTGNKRTPPWIYRSTAECWGAYLRGLFDGDGTVCPRPNGQACPVLSNTSNNLIDGAQAILRSLGVIASKRADESRRDGRKVIYSLNIQDEESIANFETHIGFEDSAKAAKLRNRTRQTSHKQPRIRVDHVEKRKGAVHVYDIQTECETFWTDGLLVHNCFINSVEDSMESILELAKTEGMLFKYGSGTGTNLSPIRSSRETITGGGVPSGPVSFMKGYDAFAGVIKSGGGRRRAAKMIILNADHPDIVTFIDCKAEEERKAWALIDAGYDGSLTGPAYASIFFQNANNSVRVPDEFMRAVLDDTEWHTRAVTGDRRIVDTHRARDLMHRIAERAHACGDPGIQFDTTINDWHTCPETARINASNPCCFSGDTIVLTSEGRIRIDALATMNGADLPLAVTYDPESRLPVLRRIRKAWKAGETRTLTEVTTEKGLRLRCTPEHQFYLRNGRAVAATDLEPGQRLSKIGLSQNTNRSCRHLLQHRTTPEAPNGCSIYARWLFEQAHGPIPPGMDVHHRNGIANDDRLSNLKLVEGVEHATEHACGSRNPRFIDTPAAKLVDVWDALEEARPGWAVTPARWNRYIAAHALDGVVAKANPVRGIRGMTWSAFANWIEEQRTTVNDRVKAVRRIDVEPTEVYDLEVEGVHRFAVSSRGAAHGAIVSNSEYMFLDDSACNLASLNLLAFVKPDNPAEFDVDAFRAGVRTMITAQEILVGNASYPTEAIERNSHAYRPLGLGYANLGALLMSHAIPYDSDAARRCAAAITAVMTGEAYTQSARIARDCGGPFSGYGKNAEPFLRVMRKHRDALGDADLPQEQQLQIRSIWDEAIGIGEKHGFRNAQATVLAPTGTIAFMMDCDTTGIEPDIALVKYKHLVGGGTIRIVNRTVPTALRRLGYDDEQIERITSHIEKEGAIEGAGDLKPDDLPVFDCAYRPAGGERSIHYSGHLKMVAAAQPFISGAISKTVNLPNEATVDDMEQAYMDAWGLGTKSVSVYRDGSKRAQPLNTELNDKAGGEPPQPVRRKLPDERDAVIHKFDIAGYKGYVTIGLFEDGSPGEMFLVMSKEGSTISGFADSFAQSVSYNLQYGVPLQTLVDKFSHTRFEPAGLTKNPEVRIAKSIVDYVFRWMATRFLSPEAQLRAGVNQPREPESADSAAETAEAPEDATAQPADAAPATPRPTHHDQDAPPCVACGSIMIRNGACYSCINCGATSGCG